MWGKDKFLFGSKIVWFLCMLVSYGLFEGGDVHCNSAFEKELTINTDNYNGDEGRAAEEGYFAQDILRSPILSWVIADPKYPKIGQEVLIKGQVVGLVKGQRVEAKLKPGKSLLPSIEKETGKARTIAIPMEMGDDGVFRAFVQADTSGFFQIEFNVSNSGQPLNKVLDIEISPSGIPGLNIDFGKEPSLTDTPTVEVFEMETEDICVPPQTVSTYPEEEVMAVQFKDIFTEVLNVFLENFLNKARAGLLGMAPEIFSNDLKQFQSASDLGNFLGVDIPDELFSLNFDLPSLICLTGETEDCGEDAFTDSGFTVHIPFSEIELDWDQLIQSVQVDVIANDPNLTIGFSMNADFISRAIFRIQGTGNPLDPVYQLLFPVLPFYDVHFDANSLSAEIQGTAVFDTNGGIQEVNLEMVPDGTAPWDLSEIETFFATEIADIEAWIVAVMLELELGVGVPFPTPGTSVDDIYLLLNSIPFVGPVVAGALPVAAPIITSILWEGLYDPNQEDCDPNIDFSTTSIDFENVTHYGMRYIILSYATYMLQAQMNGVISNLDTDQYITELPVSIATQDFNASLGPLRMNADYPNAGSHILGGSAQVTLSTFGNNSCMSGQIPGASPSFPSDTLTNPEPLFPQWGVYVGDWHASINLHQGFFQNMVNQVFDSGAFCNSFQGTFLNYDFNMNISELSYPVFELTTTPSAQPLQSGAEFTMGTIHISKTGGAGVVFELTINNSRTIELALDVRAEFQVMLEADALSFDIRGVEYENLSISNVDPVADFILYNAILLFIDGYFDQLLVSSDDLGITDGIPLPYAGFCVELVGYGAWEYCDIDDKGAAILVRFNEAYCP